jgi:hypothetical protein
VIEGPELGSLPASAPRLDGSGTLCPPDRAWTPAMLAACGIVEVASTPRPADTDATTRDRSVVVIAGAPFEAWTERPWTQPELDSRSSAAAQQAKQAADRAILDATAALAAAAHDDGQPWTQPTGAHDAYRLDATCTDGGKDWVSLIDFNVHRPGISGWREVGTEWPDWVQPTGSHDAYSKAAKVTHSGLHWISDLDGNVWVPGQYGWTQA